MAKTSKRTPSTSSNRHNGRETAKEKAFRLRKHELEHQRQQRFEDAQGEETVNLVDHPSESGSDSDSEPEEQQENHRVTSKTTNSSRSKGAVLEDSSTFHHSNLTNQEPQFKMATTRSNGGAKTKGSAAESGKSASKSARASSSSVARASSSSVARAARERTPKHKKAYRKRSHEEEEQSDYDSDASRSSKTDTRSGSGVSDLEALRIENQKLKASMAFMAEGVSMAKGSKKDEKKGVVSAMKELVNKATKSHFFKVGKFVCGPKTLDRATEIVLDSLDVAELKDLSAAEKELQMSFLVTLYKETVRGALNDQRNYISGELYKVAKGLFEENKLNEAPDTKQILEIALRNGLEDTDPNHEQMMDFLVFYWDVLIPKVAGHKCWGPGKRHYGLISFFRPQDDPDKELYVTPSDEAFLVVLWENYYPRWKFEFKQGKRTDEEKKADAAKAKKEAEKLKKEGKKPQPEKDSVSPYTLPKSGVNKFGGWNQAGRERYTEVLNLIKESKEKANIQTIEQLALTKIREKHGIEERESKRKKKKNQDKVELDDEKLPDWF